MARLSIDKSESEQRLSEPLEETKESIKKKKKKKTVAKGEGPASNLRSRIKEY